jgi:hypothetical protein
MAEASRKDLGGADVVLGEKSGTRSLLPWMPAGISRGPYPLGWNVKNVITIRLRPKVTKNGRAAFILTLVEVGRVVPEAVETLAG